MAFQFELLPDLVSVVGMMILAIFLLGLNFNHRVNRALSLVLVMRSLSGVSGVTGFFTSDPAFIDLWGRLSTYFLYGYQVALLYLVSVFPIRRKWVPSEPFGAAPFLGFMGVLWVLYALDHSLSGIYGLPGDVLSFAFPLLFAIIPLLLVRDYLKEPGDPRREAGLLLGVGFALIDFHDALIGGWQYATGNPVAAAALPNRLSGTASPLSGGFERAIGDILELAIFGVLLVVLVRAASGSGHAKARSTARRFLALLVVSVVTAGIAIVTASAGAHPAGTFAGRLFAGLWNLALPVFVTYAVVRHQLFDIDVRLKWTLKRGTLAALFVAVFFIVAQVAQAYLTTEYGLLLGGISAGLLLFALTPLQRFAERVADTAMPGVKSMSEMTNPERTALYRKQAAVAWADGNVDKNERLLLDNLREHLGISHEEAARIEGEIVRG
jgi:hypothetical protein